MVTKERARELLNRAYALAAAKGVFHRSTHTCFGFDLRISHYHAPDGTRVLEGTVYDDAGNGYKAIGRTLADVQDKIGHQLRLKGLRKE